MELARTPKSAKGNVVVVKWTEKNRNGRNFPQTAFRKRCVRVPSGLTTYWQIPCINININIYIYTPIYIYLYIYLYISCCCLLRNAGAAMYSYVVQRKDYVIYIYIHIVFGVQGELDPVFLSWAPPQLKIACHSRFDIHIYGKNPNHLISVSCEICAVLCAFVFFLLKKPASPCSRL